jgi:hypothetical protein
MTTDSEFSYPFLLLGTFLIMLYLSARSIQANIQMENKRKEKLEHRRIYRLLSKEYGFCNDCETDYFWEKGGYVCSFCGGLNTEKRMR